MLAAVLIMVSKLLEFKMSALVLTEMSAFELKAWLGLCLFASYATDIITATDTFSVLKLLAIVVTAAGLFMIARSEREHISYKKICLLYTSGNCRYPCRANYMADGECYCRRCFAVVTLHRVCLLYTSRCV